VFAASKHDASELIRVVSLALAVQALVAIPAGIGVALVAEDAILALLGPNWSAAVPIAQIIAIASVPLALSHSATYMLTAMGKIKTVCIYSWSKVAFLIATLVVALPSAGPRDVAIAMLATSCFGLIVVQILARLALPGFGGRRLLLEVWRPFLAALAMAAVVTFTTSRLPPALR